jgi:hypothetical protein
MTVSKAGTKPASDARGPEKTVSRICIEFAAIAMSAFHSEASAGGVNETL